MKVSPLGAMIVAVGLLAGIVIWVAGYFGLPNADTHRDLAKNPAIESSVQNNAQATSTGGASGTSSNAGGGGGTAAAAAWYSLDKAPNTLDLTITAAETSDGNGMNFNGYSNGALKVSVPQGWKVNISFLNKDSNIGHSVGVTDFANHTQVSNFPAAFPGSLGPNFNTGIVASDGTKTFSFTATKAGKYAMVCGIPGHSAAGMWDEFDVTSGGAPTITTPSGTVTVK